MRMLSSGVQKCFEPSRIERNSTPSSESLRVSARLKIWKPPESVRMGRSQFMNAVQAAGVAHDVSAGAQVEVVGVGEQDLRPEIVQLGGGDALDRGARADGHEDGRLHGTVGGVEASPARRGGGIAREELEVEEGHASDCT